MDFFIWCFSLPFSLTNINGQYHFPTITGAERFLKMGKLKSGWSARIEVSRPRASFRCIRCKLELRTFHPFLLRTFGGMPSGAIDLAKKPPLWWLWILTCWYRSLRLKGFGFLSLKISLKQHAMTSPSREHLYAFLQGWTFSIDLFIYLLDQDNFNWLMLANDILKILLHFTLYDTIHKNSKNNAKEQLFIFIDKNCHTYHISHYYTKKNSI